MKEVDKPTIILVVLNITLSIIDRITRQKISKHLDTYLELTRREMFSHEVSSKRLAGNSYPHLTVDCCEKQPRSVQGHSQPSNPGQQAFLTSSISAASSSSFLLLCVPCFDGWLTLDITDNFVLGYDHNLTFQLTSSCVIISVVYSGDLQFQRCTHTLTYNKQLLTNNTSDFTPNNSTHITLSSETLFLPHP